MSVMSVVLYPQTFLPHFSYFSFLFNVIKVISREIRVREEGLKRMRIKNH